ncbi:MAG: Mur ligase family protein, partial [Dehalococcoidia bacterium]
GQHGTLTTFEVLTALALLYFKRRGVRLEVLEVGVGGRLDATNVVQPQVCAITSLSYDHMELLGHTLADIAGEKAGIIKPGAAVVTAPQAPEADAVLDRVCARTGARRIRVGSDVAWEGREAGLGGQQFRVLGLSGQYDLETPLLGDHQLENAAVAVGVLEELGRKGWSVPSDSIFRGLRDLHWPGRLDLLSERPLLVADGAHNGYSAGKLRQSLVKYFRFEKALFIIGVSSDKKIGDIANELRPIASRVIVTRSRHPRAAAVSDVAPAFQALGIIVDVADGVEQALGMAFGMTGPKDLICATGSLFIVGEVIEVIRRVPAELYTGLPCGVPLG